MALVPNAMRAAGLGWGPDWIRMLMGRRGGGGGGGGGGKSESYYADLEAKKRAQNWDSDKAIGGQSMQSTSIGDLIKLLNQNPFTPLK